ncbi:MAG: M48 family metalloprotease [Candidatus Kaiserbacteria bacterium]|nr:M48 family metalloprotease [Candidatus Kaiserbacteria bacterium]MCB9815892.1 M48 family metalloprotease [Candidatus Nomurabacteria bacterium]
MSTLYTHQASNVRKTFALMGVFLVFVIAISYGVSWYLNSSAILYVGVIFAVATSIGSYWFSDKIVLRMTNARQVSHAEAPELYNIVENLAITAGLPMPKVYIVEDPAPNAFATGRDPEHAVVAATTGLLQILDRTELEGVMAHELSHVGNRDMLVMTVAVVLAGFIAILADFFSRTLMYGGGNNRDRHPAFLIIGIVGIILAPIAAKLIQLAISRKREYLADATGALLTRYPEGLASALEKISTHAQPMRKASHATAHLFISDPFKGERGVMQKIGGLFQTHPPAEERIARLRDMDA